jgi:hypothetical protein
MPRDEIFTAVGAIWEAAFAYSTLRIIWYIIPWNLVKGKKHEKVNKPQENSSSSKDKILTMTFLNDVLQKSK